MTDIVPFAGMAQEETLVSINTSYFARILRVLLSPFGYDKALGRYRATTVVESGTVTTVNTLTAIDGRNGSMLINANSRAAWTLSHRSRIS